MTEGILELDVSITHPFSTPVLTGFDVMGVVIGNGTLVSSHDPGVVWAGTDDLQVINADGYTRWMNPTEFTQSGLLGYTEGIAGTHDVDFTATISGYKYYADGLEADQAFDDYISDPLNIAKRGAFLPDTTNKRSYILKFSMVGGVPQLQFQYAILAHWKRAKDPGGDPIPDPLISEFPPGANAQEVVNLICDASDSTAWYISDTENGGNVVLDLVIYDWQGVLSPEGVIGEVEELIVEAQSGMFSGGIAWSMLELLSAEISSGVGFTNLVLTIPDVSPTGPEEEILMTVKSVDPTDYDSGLGAPYPVGAHLAGYFRVNIPIKDEKPNECPEIESIEGKTAVNCVIGEETYTCNANDPDEDELDYTWEVVQAGTIPMFPAPAGPGNTFVVDWADDISYPYGQYEVWVKVMDGKCETIDMLSVIKSENDLVAGMIQAESDHTDNVTCDVIGSYTADANDCDPLQVLEYRWIIKHTTEDTPPDPSDPEWTDWNLESTAHLIWDDTEIGQWRLWYHVREMTNPSVEATSPALAIERVNSIPVPDIPTGPIDVDTCSDEQYDAYAVEGCDADQVITRFWAADQVPTPPVSGWTEFTGMSFVVDYLGFEPGIWYLFQKADDGIDEAVSEGLDVTVVDAPIEVGSPDGPDDVNCTDTGSVYAVIIEDCDEGPPPERHWGITDIPDPNTVTAWHSFIGDTFGIDWSTVPSGPDIDNTWYLFIGAHEGGDWEYCDPPLTVVRHNSAPSIGNFTGPGTVSCEDSPYSYTVGAIIDCDMDDTHACWYAISPDGVTPPVSGWIEFSSDAPDVDIDFTGTQVGSYYLWVKINDGFEETTTSSPPSVTMENSPPDTPEITGGPTIVDCTSGLSKQYTITQFSDCDVGQSQDQYWGMSNTNDPGTVSVWTPCGPSSFMVYFADYTFGYWHLFVYADDGVTTSMSASYFVQYNNSPPSTPSVPSGLTPVYLFDNQVESYYVDVVNDCDDGQTLTRAWGVSTSSGSQPGSWTQFPTLAGTIQVDWGVYGVGTWYLWQKVSDDYPSTSYSGPFQVVVEFIDQDIIFVATAGDGGDDDNPGTWDEPLLHVSHGISLAQSEGYREVWVALGTYNESSSLVLVNGISLYGGRVPWNLWREHPSVMSVLQGANPAIEASMITLNTKVRRFDVTATDGTETSRNSTAVQIIISNDNLRFEQCTLRAGTGYDGDDGTNGMTVGPGGLGAQGNNGCEHDGWPCNTCSQPLGGVGGGGQCMMNGGNGGTGSYRDTQSQQGQGGVGGAMGGQPAFGSNHDGYPGQNGADGFGGAPGAGGNGVGTVIPVSWIGDPGSSGDHGGNGGGGGGGSGGTGWNSPFGCDGYGAGGGGGGGGGCAGRLGTGGQAGGGSFCVFTYQAYPVLDTCMFYADNGGDGGDGGVGSTGNTGAPGRPGGFSYWYPSGGGNGGPGGDGGDGGNGGHGGGGGGGISWCVYHYGTETPSILSPVYNTAIGGSGGSVPPGGNPGANGQSGTFY